MSVSKGVVRPLPGQYLRSDLFLALAGKCLNTFVRLCERLLELSSDLTAYRHHDGHTLLTFAIAGNHCPVAHYLITRHGQLVNVPAERTDETPLHVAIRFGTCNRVNGAFS